MSSLSIDVTMPSEPFSLRPMAVAVKASEAAASVVSSASSAGVFLGLPRFGFGFALLLGAIAAVLAPSGKSSAPHFFGLPHFFTGFVTSPAVSSAFRFRAFLVNSSEDSSRLGRTRRRTQSKTSHSTLAVGSNTGQSFVTSIDQFSSLG